MFKQICDECGKKSKDEMWHGPTIDDCLCVACACRKLFGMGRL